MRKWRVQVMDEQRNKTLCMEDWKRDVSLEGYVILPTILDLTPLWVFGTICVSIYGTSKHLRRDKHLSEPNRFFTTWVLALPPIYGCCTMFAVQMARLRGAL